MVRARVCIQIVSDILLTWMLRAFAWAMLVAGGENWRGHQGGVLACVVWYSRYGRVFPGPPHRWLKDWLQSQFRLLLKRLPGCSWHNIHVGWDNWWKSARAFRCVGLLLQQALVEGVVARWMHFVSLSAAHVRAIVLRWKAWRHCTC